LESKRPKMKLIFKELYLVYSIFKLIEVIAGWTEQIRRLELFFLSPSGTFTPV
jgi:hypothetical protein